MVTGKPPTTQTANERTPNLAEERCGAALLLIDVINDFEYPGGDTLVEAAPPAFAAMARLKKRCGDRQIPTIYVNDNFGRWRSDLRTLVRHCLRPGAPGRKVVELLKPGPRDYFVLKPQNSGFFSTVLEALLRHLGAQTLILCGLSTDNCILFTAHDAYLRKFHLFVPPDCSAAETRTVHARAIELISRTTKADVRRSARIPVHALRRG